MDWQSFFLVFGRRKCCDLLGAKIHAKCTFVVKFGSQWRSPTPLPFLIHFGIMQIGHATITVGVLIALETLMLVLLAWEQRFSSSFFNCKTIARWSQMISAGYNRLPYCIISTERRLTDALSLNFTVLTKSLSFQQQKRVVSWYIWHTHTHKRNILTR